MLMVEFYDNADINHMNENDKERMKIVVHDNNNYIDDKSIKIILSSTAFCL